MTNTKWVIDPNHSTVQFKVKHLMIANITGTFNVFKGEVQTESEDFNDATVSFEINTNSIDTNMEQRDKDLKSPLFLDTEKFPLITFNGLLKKKPGNYELAGELTLREIKRAITLEVELTGSGKGRFGDIRTGFEANGKLNRKDFGINVGLVTETGSLVVGEEIKLHFDIELIKQ